MALYPSCLYNRTQEARSQLSITKQIGTEFAGYPYHIIDLSVRMRPIVEEIDKARKSKLQISLLTFEPSRCCQKNNKYADRKRVNIMIVLGALIHERYVHIGAVQGDEQTIRLDVISDKGRWIVKFSEFLDGLNSYLLTRDEIAMVVCNMIDNYRNLVEKDESKYRTLPPNFGNYDLDWLLWEYASLELSLKRTLLNEIFKITDMPDHVLAKVRFNANEIGEPLAE